MKHTKLLQQWDIELQNTLKEIDVPKESVAEKKARIEYLESHPEEWNRFYFPNFYTADCAPFQAKASKRIFAHLDWLEVRAWSRDMAKSTRAMFEVLQLVLKGKLKNILLVSSSQDNAIRLLAPFKYNLEFNQRIIADYGEQVLYGHWSDDEFVTKKRVSFRAIGVGQSPRGSRNDAERPDCILIDDIDTDEECRNPELIDKKWHWIENALLPTRSVSANLLVLFLGNIIAEYCCITKAMKIADHVDIVNIRTNGISSWPAKNSEAQIDRVLSTMSYAAQQREYFNNPITEGSTFKDIYYDKVPELKKFSFLVAYGDPSPSNNETKKNSYKAVVLVGRLGVRFYVIKCFLEQTQNAKFVDWYYELDKYVNGQTIVFHYIENNSLQDPFYEQVFRPLIAAKAQAEGKVIPIMKDERKKADKFTRIEGTLESLNRVGSLIFSEAEKNNPHMMRLVDQFKIVSPQSKALIDGPDAVEAAVWITNNKLLNTATIAVKGSFYKNNKKF